MQKAADNSEQVSIVDMTETIYNQEQKLHNALVATPCWPCVPPPSIQDIYLAVERKCGSSGKPIDISSFPPDFILYFPDASQKKTVLDHKTIEGPNFRFTLVQWTNKYRSQIAEWNTHVSLQIEGIPPQLFFYDCLKPLLLPYCGIRTADFDKSIGTCKVNAYTKNLQSIPTEHQLGIHYHRLDGVTTHTFPITLATTPYIEQEQNPSSKWAQDPSADVNMNDYSSHYDPGKHFLVLNSFSHSI